MKKLISFIAFFSLLTTAGNGFTQETETVPVPAAQSASSSIQPLNAERAKGVRSSEKWKWTQETGLRCESIRHTSAGFWASADKLAYDGVLRVQLNVGKRPDSSVFFRASFPNDPVHVSGYSVSFDRNYVQLHRWDGGYPQEVGKRIKLKSLPKLYDVIISMKGTHVSIDVQDGSNHKSLASFSLNDARYHGNETGYRVHRKQDKKSSWIGHDFKPAAVQSEPTPFHADAYLSQLSSAFVFVPEKSVKSTTELKKCKAINNLGIENYRVYKCPHASMMALVDDKRMLPDGFYWSDSRNAFNDSEYRKSALDLNCNIPMHCQADAPLDPNRSAKDADMVQAYIDEYAKVCSGHVKHVRIETIGQSYLGHKIRAVVLSNADSPANVPKVLFNGAHHGMELLATDMAFDILEQLCEAEVPELRKQYEQMLSSSEVWVIPLVNYDGNDLFFHVSDHLGRKNGRFVFTHEKRPKSFPRKPGLKNSPSAYYRYHPNDIALGAGVDINRNYPLQWGATGEKASSENPRHYWYRGTAPASEPEIQAMMNLFHTEQFASSISFHTVSTRILSPYSIDALQNPPHEEDNAWQLALRMASAAGVQANGKPYEVVKNLYSVDGTDQDWFRMISGTYAYLIEGSLHNPVGDKRRSALEKNRPAWVTFLDAARRSTTVSVRDSAGNPLMAEVHYSDEPYLNGEHWYTTCEGMHHMLCFGEREVTVTVSDGKSQTKKVTCNADTPNIVEFVFDRPENDEPLAMMDEKTAKLMGVDAFCDLKNHTCPHLPAHRYCLIDNECVLSGQKKDSKKRCNPVENNRGWSSL